MSIEQLLRTRSNAGLSAAALGAGNMSDRDEVVVTEDMIEETIRNWDVEAGGQRIFVARLKHERSAGGVILTDGAKDDQCDGIVISAGPLAYVNDVQPKNAKEEAERLGMHPDDLDCATRRFLKPGDRITFGKWSGDHVNRTNTVKKGLKKLMVMNADDYLGKPRKVK